MYLDYWQLAAKPFEPTADRTTFIRANRTRRRCSKLRYAVENRRGAVLLAGPAGVGKTMLVRILPTRACRKLSAASAPGVSADVEPRPVGVPGRAARRTAGRSAAAHGRGKRPPAAIVPRAAMPTKAGTRSSSIDEAHLLEDCGALETLRLLLNFEADGQPTLTLLLVGQMGLVSAVGRLPSLEERISVKTLLRSFTAEETARYVRHRLEAAGATRDIFTPDALEALHYLAHGTPRQINRLGDLALFVGFADRLPQLTAQQIEAVSEELVAIAAE